MAEVAVTGVEVEADGDGSLVVRWELDGDGAVDVAVGPTPEAVDHRRVLQMPAGQREARISGLAPGRHYVSVAPSGTGGGLVAAERRVPFEGVVNFRDLGGYPTASGGRTRWGRVFRADSLHQLTRADLVAFERLGVRVIYDLRRDDEIQQNPNPVPSRQMEILGRRRPLDVAAERRELQALQEVIDGERRLHRGYLGMLELSAPVFGRILAGLAEPEGTPAVFHCAGGKDRTGMTAALLLSWLGVDRETVLDDYELTARWRTKDHESSAFIQSLRSMGMSTAAIEGLLSVPRWAMADALHVVDTEYGGIEAYLRGPAGMDETALIALRRTLVD